MSFSKQVQEEKQVKKQYEGAIKALEEKKESEEKLRLKTNEVHEEAHNEKIFLAAEENKMKLHYESKMKIFDIKVSSSTHGIWQGSVADRDRRGFTNLKFLKSRDFSIMRLLHSFQDTHEYIHSKRCSSLDF